MKEKPVVIAFLAFFLVFCTCRAHAFDPKDYPPSTIAEMLQKAREYYQAQLQPGSPYSDNFIAFNMRGGPFSAGVNNLNKTRPLSESAKKLMDMWGKTRSMDLLGMYKKEILIRDSEGAEFWIPIQEPHLEAFRKECKPNGKVILYLLWIATTKTDTVFIINEFEAVE